MSQKQADAWRGMWKNYVPLRGVEGKDELPRIGRGFNILGPESRHAIGRASKAGDLLAHVVSQAEEAIVRGEKNRVGQAFLKFVVENPSEHWQVKNIQFKPTLDPETGEMRFERDPFYTLSDDVLTVKRGGKEIHVKLADEALAEISQEPSVVSHANIYNWSRGANGGIFRAALPRLTLRMMSFADFVQTKGFGSALLCSM